MTNAQLWLEGIKLTAQFVGALIVARFAVRWAISRHKTEKVWEQRLAAYTEAIASMGQMRLILGQWLSAEEEGRSFTEEYDALLSERMSAARLRWENSISVARLILPHPVAEALQRAHTEYREYLNEDRYSQLDKDFGVIDKALEALVNEGRLRVGIAAEKPASRRRWIALPGQQDQ